MLLTPLRRRAARAGAALCAVAGVAAAGAATAGTANASFGIRPLGTTITTSGTPTAGAIFPWGMGSDHTCSGTVVSYAGEPVVLTAAHCITGNAVGWTFVPQYNAGSAPKRAWTVAAAYVDPRWNGGRGAAYDVAVLRLNRQWIDGAWRHIGYLTGSNLLSGAPAGNTIVDIAGYGSGRNDHPLGCSSKFWWQNGYGYASCSWLPTGVSGSGMRYGNDGHGHQYVGGLIGGYHQGGCNVNDAYTPPFGSWVRTLFARANAKAPGDSVPQAVWDGCSNLRP